MMARVIHPNQRYGLACARYDAALALRGRHEVLLRTGRSVGLALLRMMPV
jgi:hypothetical protein